ncbi:MAG: PAS domain S-box protein, partial [Rhodocyclaceae bacterium]|nr:PAS domain S-box protein [Rhodocyclaceae bacterium]
MPPIRLTAMLQRLWPDRLRHQLALLFALLFAASIAVYAAYMADEQAEFIEDLLRNHARASSAQLAASLPLDTLGTRPTELATLLARAGPSTDLRGLALVREDGRVVAATRLDERRQAIVVQSVGPVRPPAEAQVELEGQVITAWVPVGLPPDSGWLRAEFDGTAAASARGHIRRDTLVVGTIMVVAATLLVLAFLRRPLAALRRATDFATTLDSQAGDFLRADSPTLEIRELADALNWASIRLFDQHNALTDSERRKSAIFDAAQDCIVTVDASGIVTEFNPAAETTFGYGRDEVMGRPMQELLVPVALRPVHEQGFEHVLRTGDVNLFGRRREVTALRKDGSEFPAEITVTRFEVGGNLAFTAFVQDISERRRAQAALEEQLHFVRQLLDSVPLPLYVKDREGYYLMVNKAWEQALGK